jgi:drug/metabolite transporter (DMT)-like permease
LRYLVAVAAIWPLLALSGRVFGERGAARGWTLPRRRVWALLGAGILNALGSVGLFFAFARLPVGAAILVFYSYPAMVAAISFVLGEPATRRKLAALGLALVGVGATVGSGEEFSTWEGVVAALGGALAAALFIVVSGRFIGDSPPLMALAYVLSGSAGLVTLTVVLGHVRVDLAPAAWAAGVGMGLVGTVAATGAFVAGLARVGPTRAATLATLEPVFAVGLAAVFLGERPGVTQLIGGALIITAVVLLATEPPPGRGR